MKEVISWALTIFWIGGFVLGGGYVLIKHLKFKKWIK